MKTISLSSVLISAVLVLCALIPSITARPLAAAPILLAIIVLPMVFSRWRETALKQPVYWVSALSFCIIIPASMMWSIDSAATLETVTKSLPIVVCGMLWLAGCIALSSDELNKVVKYLWFFPLLICAGFVVMITELVFGFPLRDVS